MSSRIDEILIEVRHGRMSNTKAKQAILQALMDAKPDKRNTEYGDLYQRTFGMEYNKAIDQYTNAIKELFE